MNSQADISRELPDIATSGSRGDLSALDWVGMDGIDLPMQVLDGDGEAVRTPVNAGIFVDLLGNKSRGIHMSRLYLLLQQYADTGVVTPASVDSFLEQVLDSHADISGNVRLVLRFDYLIRRPAIKSDNAGWKAYPVEIVAERGEAGNHLRLKVSTPYSSTCPCSAALARQLTAEAFRKDFSGDNSISMDSVLDWLNSDKGSTATPHSQRSWAHVEVHLAATDSFLLPELIDTTEQALQTAVQTAVKREDEQAFAGLNGANLMFCEDAARRLKSALELLEQAESYDIKVEHLESLHPHNAVASATGQPRKRR